MRNPVPALRLGDLTDKQREVLSLIADNRTSKEIAGYLGITESAVNQRVESVRARLGGAPRAQLARLYRQLANQETGEIPAPLGTCNSLTADNFQLTENPQATDTDDGSQRVAPYLTEGSEPADNSPVPAPTSPRVVPVLLDGEHGTLNRIVAMVAIAVGLLVLVLVSLGVAQALDSLV